MFYYLYKITNLLNNKIYVGVHKTHDMNDGYMGSGKVIKRAIEKYGIDNFRKDILETFQDEESMYAREKEFVTEDFLSREDVYNLRRGGSGGFDFINKNMSKKERKYRCSKAGIANQKKLQSNPEQKNQFYKRNSAIMKEHHSNGFQKNHYEKLAKIGSKYAWTEEARKKRQETFKRIEHQKGSKHSQYGTIWITDGVQNKKIKKDDIIPNGWNKGRRMPL